MTSSSTPAAPAPQGERADRISPIRVALWAAIAVVLATGVVLYFRHEKDVAPVLGAAPVDGGGTTDRAEGHR